MRSFAEHLDIAIKAARAAGDLLRADFHRPTGPRGAVDKAPADTEAEQLIRNILLGEGSGDEFGFLGEETGSVPGAPGAPIWVIDPNDGTRDYIRGRRGSSVSIALVWDRRPVLGVVHPFGYPDDRGSVYAAVDGCLGVWKDGAPVAVKLPEQLSDLDVVLVSGGGDRAPQANLQCAKPARVMAIPSIAHRLARVAAGEASATTSLYSPRTWDFAAGHCLILAAGGVVVDQHGNEPVYGDDADGTATRLFAGSRPVALALSRREWDRAFQSEREKAVPIVRLRKGGATSSPHTVARAQGALLGHLIGSALSGTQCPPTEGGVGGPSKASNLPPFDGQLGSSGEVAITCARSLLDYASDDRNLMLSYAAWSQSAPRVPDRAMESAAQGHRLSNTLSAFALVRVTPLTLWCQATEPAILVAKVRADTALTHASAIEGDAAATLAMTLHALIQGSEPVSALDEAHAFARRSGLSREVIDTIVESKEPPRATRANGETPGVLTALHAALFSLASETSFESAIERALALSPDSDALPALVGAVMGARFGRIGIPEQMQTRVLSWRPLEGFTKHPRPAIYWATDTLAMAEALLTAR